MKKYLVFTVKENNYAIDTKYVLEMKRNIKYSKILTNNKNLIGIYNLYNRVISILDLNSLLLDIKGSRICDSILVFKNDDDIGKFSIEIDLAVDIINDCDMVELKTSAKNVNKNIITKVTKVDDTIIQIIDYNKMKNKILNKENYYEKK